MKKIEVLAWGVQHIASNYQMGASTEDYQEDGQMCIFVTEAHPDVSPAPINDIQMLCESVGIDRSLVEVDEYGVTVYLDYAWVHTAEECEGYCDTAEAGKLLVEYQPTGHEMWKKIDAIIGA